jgi:DNA repair protein SbcD/Mre11
VVVAGDVEFERVADKLAATVLAFCEGRSGTFHIEDLADFVKERHPEIAPDSPGRILRALRSEKRLNYRVVSRRDSLYELTPIEPERPADLVRLMVVGDIHIRAKTPRSRKDDFLTSLLDKLWEIGDIARREGVTHICLVGDVFDAPDVSLSCATAFLEVVDSWELPVLTIAGNHDVYGLNPETMGRTVFGHMTSRERSVTYVGDRDNKPRWIKLGPWTITGLDYRPGIETRLKDADEGNRWLGSFAAGSFVALIVHAQVTPRPFPWGDSLRPSEIAWPAAVVACGHYHPGCPEGSRTALNGLVASPGALCRLAFLESELVRAPQVSIVDLFPNGASTEKRVILQSAKPSSEIFDEAAARSETEMSQQISAAGIHFVETRNSIVANDPVETLRRVGATLNTPTPVLSRAVEVVQRLAGRA